MGAKSQIEAHGAEFLGLADSFPLGIAELEIFPSFNIKQVAAKEDQSN